MGSFINIRGGNACPFLIRNSERKPPRVFLQAVTNDRDNKHGDWPLGNREMAAALKFMGYDHRFKMGAGARNGNHGGAILPDSLWRSRP